MNLGFGFEGEYEDETGRSLSEQIASEELVSPFFVFEILFFAQFGLQKPEDLMISKYIQPWTIYLVKLVFATYLLMCAVVLINLLIAMMSDTYQVVLCRVVQYVLTNS